jgi:toxin HigB-1
MSHESSPMAGMAGREYSPHARRSQTSVTRHLTPLIAVLYPQNGIESIRHKGLRRFFETGNAKGLVGDAGRLRKMLAFIDAAESFKELSVPPNFGLHELTGDRKGNWSMTVTRNWRMTFGLNDEGALIDMDLEDYHGA